jgi:CitMHS family citrate-Mg2+:H+ or citrate-Ca2+:H+ symporter
MGLLLVLGISYFLGIKERQFVKVPEANKLGTQPEVETKNNGLARPKLLWFNIALIILSVATLISAVAPPHIIFIIAFTIAISVNYPNLNHQRERIDAHAKAALLMASILFAAGCFTGILKGSGMIDAMASSAVQVIPGAVGNHLALVTGLLSMPASLLFDPDSFYFGVLPLLGTTAAHFGGDSLEVGRAAILGQMTTGFPVSPLTGATFLLTGLTGVDLGEHQRKTIPFAFCVTLVMLFFSLLLGVIRF